MRYQELVVFLLEEFPMLSSTVKKELGSGYLYGDDSPGKLVMNYM